jgi:hypothetical protein
VLRITSKEHDKLRRKSRDPQRSTTARVISQLFAVRGSLPALEI